MMKIGDEGGVEKERGSRAMSAEHLAELIRKAQKVPVSQQDREEQRRSFAYGNTHFENESITRDTVDRAAESLAAKS
jgi:hypothetical protein